MCEAASRSGSAPGIFCPGQAFESHMRTELVTAVLHTLHFEKPHAMFHREQGKPFGAQAARQFLLEKGFQGSMSRAGTPTDNASAEQCVGRFKLAVAERCRSETLRAFLHVAQQWVSFSKTDRPHEGLDDLSPNHAAQERRLPDVPPIPLLECLGFEILDTLVDDTMAEAMDKV